MAVFKDDLGMMEVGNGDVKGSEMFKGGMGRKSGVAWCRRAVTRVKEVWLGVVR